MGVGNGIWLTLKWTFYSHQSRLNVLGGPGPARLMGPLSSYHPYGPHEVSGAVVLCTSESGNTHLGPNHGQRWCQTVRVRGYHPGKFFENSDAKSCILVTTMLINGLPRTWNLLLFWKQRPRRPIHCWSPKPNSWGTSLPWSLRLLHLCIDLTWLLMLRNL